MRFQRAHSYIVFEFRRHQYGLYQVSCMRLAQTGPGFAGSVGGVIASSAQRAKIDTLRPIKPKPGPTRTLPH